MSRKILKNLLIKIISSLKTGKWLFKYKTELSHLQITTDYGLQRIHELTTSTVALFSQLTNCKYSNWRFSVEIILKKGLKCAEFDEGAF